MPPGSPNRAPIKRDAPFLEPSHYLSQFPVNRPAPQVPQWDHYKERHPSAEPSTSHPLKIHLSLRVPSKGAPMKRDTPSPEPVVYLFMYVCQSPPKKEPSYKMGKNIMSLSTEPHAAESSTYNGVLSGSPRGLLTILLSLPRCHAALITIPSTLPWVDHSQRV